jgi:hypothetical protein
MRECKTRDFVGRECLGLVLPAGVLLFAFSLLPVSSDTSHSRPQDEIPKIAELAWISGSWQTVSGSKRFEEHWTKAARNAILGMGRTLVEDKMVFFEYLRIEARTDGIYYVAHPKAGPGTDFKLTSLDGSQALFENPQHDFPKRILYRKNPDGSITARVDGGPGVDEGVEEFHYKPLKSN